MNSPNRPLVTVYMPTHNREDRVLIAANSVLSQSYENLELIIVNDGSTDSTQLKLTELATQDTRVKIYQHSFSKGACAARNTALKHATGELITGIDDDDEFTPNRLELLVPLLVDYSFVCTGYIWRMPNKTKQLFCRDERITLSNILNENSASNQVLTKTSYLQAIGGFDETLPSFQDYDCWVRLINKFGCAYRLATPTYIVNADHDNNRISANSKSKLQGFNLFFAKHKCLMSKVNVENQLFRKKVLTNEKITMSELIKSLVFGMFRYKIKAYFRMFLKKV